MRFARAAFPRAVNPYRTQNIAAGARRSRFLGARSFARFAVLIFGAGAFAAGFAIGRGPAEPAREVAIPAACAPTACAPAQAAEPDGDETIAAPSAADEAWSAYAITPAQAKATIAARAREVLQVDYNQPSAEGQPASLGTDVRPAADPTLQKYHDQIVVQVVARRPSLDKAEDSPCIGSDQAWGTLRLVWSPHGEQWRLAALFWNEWCS